MVCEGDCEPDISNLERSAYRIEKVIAADATPREFVRDPVMLEFLGLPNTGKLLEKNMEDAILGNLQSFLLESFREKEEIDHAQARGARREEDEYDSGFNTSSMPVGGYHGPDKGGCHGPWHRDGCGDGLCPAYYCRRDNQ